MNKLNKISIKQYLAGMNIHPVKNYGYYGMYHCPFRAGRDFSIGKSSKTAFYAFISSYGVRLGAVSEVCFDHLWPALVCIKLKSKDTAFF